VVEAEGWGVGGGTPSPRGRGMGRGLGLLDLKMASFGALWVPVGGCIPLILPLDPPLMLDTPRQVFSIGIVTSYSAKYSALVAYKTV